MHLEWTAPTAWLPLLVLAIVAAGLWTRRHYRTTRPRPPAGRGAVLPWLRGLAVAAVLAGVAGPLLVTDRTARTPARVHVLVEDSASMGLADGSDGGTRWERARALAAAVDSVASRAGARVTHLRGNGLTKARPWRPVAEPEPPTAQGTDLERLLAAAVDAGAEVPRLTVLISDGNPTEAGGSGAGRLPELLVAGVGDPHGPTDLAVRDVQAPDLAFVGDEVVVEVVVGLQGFQGEGRDVHVELLHGDHVVDSTRLEAGTADRTLRCGLVDVPAEAGLRELAVRVVPDPDERYTGNNEVGLALAVRKERRRLLALASRPDWFCRSLALAAAAERRLSLETVVVGPDGPRVVGVPGGWTPPQDAEQWAEYDGVVLLDARAARLWAAGTGLGEAVAAGVGLMVAAAVSDGPWPAELAAALPAADASRGGRAVGRIVPSARSHPLLEDLRGDDEIWNRLPPLTLETAAAEAPGDAVLLSLADSDARPVLLLRDGDAGRLAWVASRELWEQCFWTPSDVDPAAQPLRRLLQSVLVWTAQGEALTGATLLAQRTVYREGEPILVRARGRGLRGRPGRPPAAVEIRALDGDAPPVRTTLQPDAADPGTVVAQLPPGRIGVHRLQLLDGEGEPAGRPKDVLVTRGSVEDMQTTQDRRSLRALSEEHGGRLLDAHRRGGRQRLLDGVAAVDLEPAEHRRRGVLRPWSTWPCLLLVAVLLGLEWFLRRRWGLI